MKISPEVLQVLEGSSVKLGPEGALLTLPPVQLDRKLYQAVNKVLEALGGRWLRNAQAHLFTGQVTLEATLDQAMILGEVVDAKKEFQFFPTPFKLAKQMVEWAEIRPHHKILEPSAGDGALLRCLPADCQTYLAVMELEPHNAAHLAERGFTVIPGDFLSYQPTVLYDRILANPPFSHQQDCVHIAHMWECLKPGGILVTLSSPSWQFRQNKKSVAFRAFLAANDADIRAIPAGEFKASGTMIRTVMIKLVKK